ncbi:uncharacterized protein [Clytia hemisphaerica]|uniref:BTB domain-containing protein n=1 Tax=Clytia hemisphaerica TaxID=252671 RepID=A0A7M5WJN1_9CNID
MPRWFRPRTHNGACVGTWKIWKEAVVDSGKSKSKFKISQHNQSKDETNSSTSSNATNNMNIDDEEESTQFPLEGTIFTLDENRDVTWRRLPELQEASENPLFEATAYSEHMRYKEIEFFLPFKESIKFELKMEDDKNMVLKYSKYHFHCKKIDNMDFSEEEQVKYSLYSFYKDALFCDYDVLSTDGKEFKFHRCILAAYFPTFNLEEQPSPLNTLSNNELEIFVHFIYNGRLPKHPDIESLVALKTFCTEQNGFQMLKDIVTSYLNATDKNRQVLHYFEECQACLTNIATLIHGNPDLDANSSESHLADPTNVLETMTEVLRELVLGFFRFIQAMYVFGNAKMSKSSRAQLLDQLQERLITSVNTMVTIIQLVSKHLDLIYVNQRTRVPQLAVICHECQPSILEFLKNLEKLSESLSPLLKKMVSGTNEKFQNEKLKKSKSKVTFILKSAYRMKEISQLKGLEDKFTDIFTHMSKKCQKSMLKKGDQEKAEIIVEFVEQNILKRIKELGKLNRNLKDPQRRKSKYKHEKNLMVLSSYYLKWFVDTLFEYEEEAEEFIQVVNSFVMKRQFNNGGTFKGVQELFDLVGDTKDRKCSNSTKEISSNNLYEKFLLPDILQTLYKDRTHADLEFHMFNPKDDVEDEDENGLSESSPRVKSDLSLASVTSHEMKNIKLIDTTDARTCNKSTPNKIPYPVEAESSSSGSLDNFSKESNNCVDSTKDSVIRSASANDDTELADHLQTIPTLLSENDSHEVDSEMAKNDISKNSDSSTNNNTNSMASGNTLNPGIESNKLFTSLLNNVSKPGDVLESFNVEYGDKSLHEVFQDERTFDPTKPVILKAHRIVVCSRCPWFLRALTSGMKEAIDRQIKVTDTPWHLFSVFIKYLYCGTFDFYSLKTDEIIDLATMSDLYEHEEFKKSCEDALIKPYHLNEENIVYMLAIADKINTPRLKTATLEYFGKHPECIASDDFDNLSKQLQHEVKQAIMMEKDRTKSDLHCRNSFSKSKFSWLPSADTKFHHSRPSLTSPESEHSSGNSDSETDSSDNDDDDYSSEREGTPRHPEEISSVTGSSNDLEECIETLRHIIVDVGDEDLMRLALMADGDSTRALNFHFGGQ